jgi:hypothetical protein
MSDRHLTRIRRLTALCPLVAAIGMTGLAISGALKEATLAGASTRITQMMRGERPSGRMTARGQSRRFGDVCDMSALPPTTTVMMQRRERQKGADCVVKVFLHR